MTQINIDPQLQAQLANLTTPAELRDDSGRTVGIAMPPGEYERLRKIEQEQRRQEYEWAIAAVSDEELDALEARADADGVEFTFEEVEAHLHRLEEGERGAPK